MRVTSTGPSLASKDHSYEQSIILSILKRGYYRPQVNVGTLHGRLIFVGPSLPSKDHSYEHSVIPTILKRGYYRPQVNVGPCQHLQAHLASFMLEHHCHPIIDVSLIITAHFSGGSILSTFSPFVQVEFMSLTYSSFPRRFHSFDMFLLFEEGPYLHHM